MPCAATWDHHLIRRWAQEHGARPAEQLPVPAGSAEPTLSFLFGDGGLEQRGLFPIPWQTFFERFDMLGLCFIADEGSNTPGTFRFFCDPTELFGM